MVSTAQPLPSLRIHTPCSLFTLPFQIQSLTFQFEPGTPVAEQTITGEENALKIKDNSQTTATTNEAAGDPEQMLRCAKTSARDGGDGGGGDGGSVRL